MPAANDIPTAPLENSIARLWPNWLWSETRLLVAVSGGADSVALLRGLLRLAKHASFIDAAHFNHGWRGQESDEDERFVAQLCQSLGVKLYVARSAESRVGLGRSEEGARQARYEYLTRVAYASGARYVATAHTASDRVETLLHNLFRGTGLAGVSTPSLTRTLDQELVLVRPLLGCTREQVLAYLDQLQQPFRSDSSNENQAFRRNFIRNTLLPMIRSQYGTQVDEKLLSFSQIAEQAHGLQQQLAVDYLRLAAELAREAQATGIIERLDRTHFAFPMAQQLAAPWPVVQQALNRVWLDRKWSLQRMNRGHWELIRKAWQPELSASAERETWSANSRRLSQHQGNDNCVVEQNLPSHLQLCRVANWIVIRTAE